MKISSSFFIRFANKNGIELNDNEDYNSILNNGRNVLESKLVYDGMKYEIDFLIIKNKKICKTKPNESNLYRNDVIYNTTKIKCFL